MSIVFTVGKIRKKKIEHLVEDFVFTIECDSPSDKKKRRTVEEDWTFTNHYF